MKFLLATVFFIAIHFTVFSQNENPDYKKSLKLYNLSTYQSRTNTTTDSLNSTSSNSKSIRILNPTFAYSWRGKNSNFNEIELVSLILNKNHNETTITSNSSGISQISGVQVISSVISLRYEYIINLLKNSKSGLIPSLGCALNPFYQHTKIDPLTSNSFPTKAISYGSNGFLIPRITYYTSTKCFFDINIPIEVFSLNNAIETVRNPQVPVRSQRTSVLDFSLLPKNFSLRIGVGVKI